MATYSTSRSVEGPFRPSNPIDLLTEFYRKNGYRRLNPELGEERLEADGETAEYAAKFVRGSSSAGWWASNMTKLPTQVEIAGGDDTITISYEVDVTGQHFTDDDRDFWQRELEAACDYLRNPSRTPRDLRHEEAKRAERIRRRMLSYGIWGAIAAFVLILMLKILTSY